jgi:hypothetical protein
LPPLQHRGHLLEAAADCFAVNKHPAPMLLVEGHSEVLKDAQIGEDTFLPPVARDVLDLRLDCLRQGGDGCRTAARVQGSDLAGDDRPDAGQGLQEFCLTLSVQSREADNLSATKFEI